MLIPRYWSRAESQATTPDGRRVHFHVWRGSRSDPAEAQALAQQAVERIAVRIQRGEGFPERYAYGDRPLREEVVREIAGTPEQPEIAITRNSYGAEVLNAARAFFIDVDTAPGDAPRDEPRHTSSSEPSSGGGVWDIVDSLPLPGGLKSILDNFRPKPSSAPAPAPSAPSRPASSGGGAQGAALGRLRTWLASHPDWRVRVYRTHSGLRYLVTHATFSPTSPEVQSAMQALGADEQYIRLCHAQKSFRARLTPKPWRIGMENPPVSFPYEGPDEEQRLREWVGRYERASQRHATCQFMEELGSGTEHPDVAQVVALHDQETKATSGLPLA
jgi:hypothetical protein